MPIAWPRVAALPRVIKAPRLPRLWQPLASGRRLGSYSRTTWPWPLIALFYIVLAGFALFYGFAFGVLSAVTLLPLVAPLALLALVVIWAMPESRRAPVKALRWFVTAFTVALLVWPNYIALEVGNLPWITALRLTGVPMTLMLLLCYARTPAFRAQLADILAPTKWITWLLAAYVLWTTITMAFSKTLSFSIEQYVVMMYTIVPLYFASAYYFVKPGAVRKFSYILLFITVVAVAVGLYEVENKHLPWVGHIPAFLAIEDPRVLSLLEGSSRAATGDYRVQAKFSTSIGLGEFMGMSVPFLIHLFFVSRSYILRAFLLLLLPAIFVVTLQTHSRLAFICLISSLVLYVLFRALLAWRDRPQSLFAPALALAYPAFMAMLLAATLVWNRLSVMVWGGGAEAASNQSRKDQWAGTWPILARNPIGHGIGTSGGTLNYVAPGTDFVTVDSFYITELLEVGVIGFALFFGMFGLGIFKSGTIGLKSRNPDTLFLIAACIALINFVLGKSVYSQTENHPLAFMILGMVVALMRRHMTEIDRLPPPPVEEELTRPRETDVLLRR